MPPIDIKGFLDVEALSPANPTSAEPDFSFDTANPHSMPLESRKRWAQDRRYEQPIGLTHFEDRSVKAQKRPRVGVIQRKPESFDNEGMVSSTPTKRTITIGDSNKVWEAYNKQFNSIQQSACKLMAKAWVKAVEPKKQSTYPYTGGDEKAPDWWPKPWGPEKDQRVRHKEPDHLYKRERVYLLIHILRMVMEPNDKQHQSIRKLCLNVTKLEEVTYDALTSFFTDKDSPANQSKKSYLKEIFEVAKMEERYKDGQIVTPDREDAEQNQASDSFSSSSQTESASQPLIAPSQMSNKAFVENVAVRSAQYPQPVVGTEMSAERQGFVEAPSMASQASSLHSGTGLGLHNMYTGSHDSSRRSSMFTTRSNYTNPTTPTMHWTQWQTDSVAPRNPPVFAFSQQTASAHASFARHTGVPMPQTPSYLPTTFDEGIARPSHNPHYGSMLRLPLSSSYQSYLPPDAAHITKASTKQSLSRDTPDNSSGANHSLPAKRCCCSVRFFSSHLC